MFASSLLFAVAASAGVPAQGTPRPMAVPERLARRIGNPEPSGIAWSSALRRYLIVSDDAGRDDERHLPCLLAMDGEGRLDDQPVPIEGIEKINDLEAICMGEEQTYFVCTSHSISKSGKRSRWRKMLLHLKHDGRAYRVAGSLDLTTVRSANGGEVLSVPGIPPGDVLDIEGIAHHGGFLYIGLKSPLAVDGAARIYRLFDPEAACAAGRAAPGTFTLWATVRLAVQVGRGEAAQGISDLAFLSDGSLILCGNSPKGAPRDGGGAVWYAADPPASLAHPVLLARFPGLKPEGVCPDSGGRHLIVVFDRDQAPPMWTTIRMPP